MNATWVISHKHGNYSENKSSNLKPYYVLDCIVVLDIDVLVHRSNDSLDVLLFQIKVKVFQHVKAK